MIKITFETNTYNRTFLYVNGFPSYTSWVGDENKPQIEVKDGKLFVDGKLEVLPKAFKSGVGDNRHRNWRSRS